MEGDRGGVKDEPRVDRLVWVEVVGGGGGRAVEITVRVEWEW